MVTLKELQRENKRLREMQNKLDNIKKSNEDRRKLLKENKRLSREIKFGKSIGIARDVGRVAHGVGKSVGRGLFRVGKGAVKGLQSYANFLAEQEARQRKVNRKLKTAKKSGRKKK